MKVIYISTNASDKVGVNATVFTPLDEKNSPLVNFFFAFEQTKPTNDFFRRCGYVLLKNKKFREFLHYTLKYPLNPLNKT